MAYMSYKNLWRSEFGYIVFKKDKVQDMTVTELKLGVHVTYKKRWKNNNKLRNFKWWDVISEEWWRCNKQNVVSRKVYKNKRSLIFIGKRLQRI